jgi:hypothetical protein
MTQDDLCKQIREAFAHVPDPGERLTECDCDECTWAVRRFSGKQSSQMEPADTSGADGGNVSLLAPRRSITSCLP